MAFYDVGDEIEVTANFTNLAGTPANPTTVTLRVLTPAGVASTVAASNTGTVGQYRGVISITEAGTWRYRFAGTGAVTAAEEGAFVVRPRRVPA